MNNLIYRSSKINFADEFRKVSEAHVTKLTFNTRDEYLVWVKQWKEDYKNVIVEIQRQKCNWKLDCLNLRPEKRDFYEKRLENLPHSPAAFTIRIGELNNQLQSDYGIRLYGSFHTLHTYLMVVRKAGKILAGRQMTIPEKVS